MLAVMGIFRLKALISELVQSNGVHSVKNVITLAHDIHVVFDSLDVWFDQTEKVSHRPSLVHILIERM